MSRHVQHSSDGLRHYYAIPFARELDEEERRTLGDTLRQTTLSTHAHTYSPTFAALDVSPARALLVFDLGPGADFTPADIGGALYAAAGGWHAEYGPLTASTRLGGRQELGTLASPSLGCASGRATADDRVGDVLDGGDSESRTRYYQLLFPSRRLTDEEVSVVRHVVGDRGVATERYVALINAPQPTTPSHLGGYGVDALRADLTAAIPPQRDTGILEQYFFDRRVVGSLPAYGVDEEAIRSAVHTRAAECSPLDDTDTQPPEPQARGD